MTRPPGPAGWMWRAQDPHEGALTPVAPVVTCLCGVDTTMFTERGTGRRRYMDAVDPCGPWVGASMPGTKRLVVFRPLPGEDVPAGAPRFVEHVCGSYHEYVAGPDSAELVVVDRQGQREPHPETLGPCAGGCGAITTVYGVPPAVGQVWALADGSRRGRVVRTFQDPDKGLCGQLAIEGGGRQTFVFREPQWQCVSEPPPKMMCDECVEVLAQWRQAPARRGGPPYGRWVDGVYKHP